MIITELGHDIEEIKCRPSKSYTICLNMIVKNESHIITKTLENLCSYVDFDAYYISDTGSTDNTIDLIRRFFSQRNIPGHIEQVEWRDFGFNRTLALQMAFNKTDYLFIFDADDSIHGDFRLPRELTHDSYQLKIGETFVYMRTLIVNNRKRWRYIGVLHEYISCVDKEESSVTIHGGYYVESGRIGSRNQDPNKYLKDAAVLERGFQEENKNANCGQESGGGRALAERYAFYCAQSWMDAGPAYIDKAIEWYLRVLLQNNWKQEKYYSALCLGNLYDKKGDKYASLKYFSKTIEYDEERIEGIAAMMDNLRADGNHVLVNALYHKYKNYNKYPQNKLFLSTDKYNDYIEYNNSVSAFYVSDKRSGYECCKAILRNNIMPYHYMTSTYTNLAFYRTFFEEDTHFEILQLFYVVDHFLSVIASKNDNYSDEDIETWKLLFAKVKGMLTAPCEFIKTTTDNNGDNYHLSCSILCRDRNTKQSPSPLLPNPVIVVKRNCKTPRIIITFTSCKRLELFQQTVNSILNMWSDIHLIDYWFCVDDNSSEVDRAVMKSRYPWIDYYMKCTQEKGHRSSMKLIWSKLKELQPYLEYWIHMEDDFLFHTPGSYVEKAMQMMIDTRNSGYNVRQILYNRNYGETVGDYKIQGHRILRRMKHVVALHQHKTVSGSDFGYANCHYWPHYSFRPSLIDVQAILTVGDYDTPNQFFEMDYARKWTDLGFLSGFYNQITNRHIGRLTTEIHDTSRQKNAYELNRESQFVSPSALLRVEPSMDEPNSAIKKKRYISTIQFDDGFGSQYQRFIWTCIYTEHYESAVFVYRSPTKIAHNYTNDPEFIRKMEYLMNMKANYTNYDDISETETIETPDFYDVFNYIEKNTDTCMKSKSMIRIKQHYWCNKNHARERQRLYCIPSETAATAAASAAAPYTHHLAVHIRRPNCDDTRPNGGEEYTNEYYIQTLLNIRNTYNGYDTSNRIQYHIYSQGDVDKFSTIKNHHVLGTDVMLHLNETTEDTFIGMTVADILVTSASSYSYTAAFLCDGDIYYTNFWHKPCSWWNKIAVA
jgi:Glycosyl transferase family 2